MKALLSLVVMFAITMSAAWLPVKIARAATAEVNMPKNSKLALGGHDPVAYFEAGAAVPGNAAYTTSYKGATWQFASAENRDRFEADPQAYAPQYGGHCAYAASRGYLADGDPAAWRVHDGKLYLNYNAQVKDLWEADVAANIAKGDRNWPVLVGQ